VLQRFTAEHHSLKLELLSQLALQRIVLECNRPVPGFHKVLDVTLQGSSHGSVMGLRRRCGGGDVRCCDLQRSAAPRAKPHAGG
jgi:hypothetical protein